MNRPKVNITPTERVIRIVAGTLVALLGIRLLRLPGVPVAVALELLLVAAGLDLLVTGALGHCPLYARLQRHTDAPRRAS